MLSAEEKLGNMVAEIKQKSLTLIHKEKVNWDPYYQKCLKARKEVKMAKKAKIKEEKTAKRKQAAKREPGGETKESKLVKLLSGKEMYTLDEIVRRTGFAVASAKMYVSQDYLNRKEKPYKVIVGKKGGKEAYRMETKK